MQPAMMALCVSSVPPGKRGSAYATYGTAADAGVAAGSVIWGLVANAMGYQMLFILNIVPAILAAFVYFTWKRSFGASGRVAHKTYNNRNL